LNCPNCGTANLDNATLCIHCGRPLTDGASAPPPPPSVQTSYTPPPPPAGSYSAPAGNYAAGGGIQPPRIPNYLVQSILITLCCCLPLGIVAIIFAAQVNQKLAAGDIAGAEEASRKAKMFCWIGFGVGLVVIILSMIFNGAMFMNAYRENMANR
jgi:hypothetical protein